jgi:hypothetical protein
MRNLTERPTRTAYLHRDPLPSPSGPARWRESRTIDQILDQLVAAAEPAVAFASLASSCVPAVADECIVSVVEDGGASLQLRQPAVPPAAAGSCELIVEVRDEPCAGAPGYTAEISYRWHQEGMDDADRVIARLLTDRAVAMIRQQRLSQALAQEFDKSHNLTEALATNRQIGQAIGILMASYKLTSQQSFDLLRGVSQHTHRKLREVADEVNQTGTLLTGPAPKTRRGVSSGSAVQR